MYRVEAIFRESTIKDILPNWTATGRDTKAVDNGQMVFENVVNIDAEHGVVAIVNNKGETFLYNVSDFCRFKVIKIDES